MALPVDATDDVDHAQLKTNRFDGVEQIIEVTGKKAVIDRDAEREGGEERVQNQLAEREQVGIVGGNVERYTGENRVENRVEQDFESIGGASTKSEVARQTEESQMGC